MKFLYLAILINSCVIMLPSESLLANRRHFTYTTESAVLPKGSHELEIWNTIRLNRKDLYRGLATRTEFEFGLGGNFQASLYLNLSTESWGVGNMILSDEQFGFSTEGKYKLLDAVSDPIGLALYGEVVYSNTETELEGKIIVDKYIDKLLFAFNAIGEHSFVTGVNQNTNLIETQTEEVMELNAGATYFITGNFTAGLEVREHIKRPPGLEGGGTYTALFVGPSLSIAGSNWWAAVSVMPQIGGSSKDGGGTLSSDKLELVEHEKFEARLLLSFEF